MGGGGGGGAGIVTCGAAGIFTGFGADGADCPPPKKNWPGLTRLPNALKKFVKIIIPDCFSPSLETNELQFVGDKVKNCFESPRVCKNQPCVLVRLIKAAPRVIDNFRTSPPIDRSPQTKAIIIVEHMANLQMGADIFLEGSRLRPLSIELPHSVNRSHRRILTLIEFVPRIPKWTVGRWPDRGRAAIALLSITSPALMAWCDRENASE